MFKSLAYLRVGRPAASGWLAEEVVEDVFKSGTYRPLLILRKLVELTLVRLPNPRGQVVERLFSGAASAAFWLVAHNGINATRKWLKYKQNGADLFLRLSTCK